MAKSKYVPLKQSIKNSDQIVVSIEKLLLLEKNLIFKFITN